MAKFQETKIHDDETPRVRICQDDLEFLKQLQSELNTQDGMGNEDPEYWCVAHTEKTPAYAGCEDGDIIATKGGEFSWDDLDSFMEDLMESVPESLMKAEKSGNAWSLVTDHGGWSDTREIKTMQQAWEAATSAGLREYVLHPYSNKQIIMPDTLFLTHASCERHLKRYGHYYMPDAQAWAMTAHDSPEYKKVISILRTADWDEIEKALALYRAETEGKE